MKNLVFADIAANCTFEYIEATCTKNVAYVEIETDDNYASIGLTRKQVKKLHKWLSLVLKKEVKAHEL